MTSRLRRLLVGGGILAALLVVAFVGNAALTPVIEGAKFRAMLEKETAKGMHLGSAQYAPLTRVGVFGMKAASGEGKKGIKTIEALSAEGITGSFNPLGVFLRRWQLEFLHFDHGVVHIQKTEGNPNAKPPPGLPWYLFFWPDHVYLKDIKCDHADVLFKLKDQESGIHDTFLEITPNGRDFEYDAKGGTFTTPDTPKLNVEHVHLLVRKPQLTCDTLILGDDLDNPEQQLRITGVAHLQQDRSMQLTVDFDSLNLAPWAPEKLRPSLRGKFDAHFDYKSTGTGLETAAAQGHVTVKNGALHELKAIRTYIAATKSPDPGDVPLDVCETDVALDQGAISIEHIDVESKGIFKLVGNVRLAKDKTISGSVELGLTDPYLRWLPSLEPDIFNKVDGPYHWTTIHIYGTSKKPQQDLSARLVSELAKHPFTALKAYFNSNSVDLED